jgi:hypothetical protein
LGKDRIFIDEEVGNPERFEHILLLQIVHFLDPLKQKEELSGERILPTIFIKLIKERVFVRVFE